MLFRSYGDHRELHRNTHSFPPRRSSDLLAPTPHLTPRGGSSIPRRTLGTPIYGLGPTNGHIWPWGRVAKMGIPQKFPTIFLPWLLPGVSIPHHFLPIYHSNEVLHRPMDQMIGIDHSGKVAPPQASPIYTKTVGNVPNGTIRYLW